ncbi:hypothetical protein, partial [Agaricicola taiwanensis]|uniref:hypothetical protein n=1 Tax=Agaricicola taiwanensis TaxID=591372 RepID=UPI001E497C8A
RPPDAIRIKSVRDVSEHLSAMSQDQTLGLGIHDFVAVVKKELVDGKTKSCHDERWPHAATRIISDYLPISGK